MKYYVMVNGKYMVSVNAQSACSAEHSILDRYADIINCTGIISSCLAFDVEGDCSYFMDCLRSCDTISIKDLDEKVKDYTGAFERGKEVVSKMNNTIQKISNLKCELHELEEELESLRQSKILISCELEEMKEMF